MAVFFIGDAVNLFQLVFSITLLVIFVVPMFLSLLFFRIYQAPAHAINAKLTSSCFIYFTFLAVYPISALIFCMTQIRPTYLNLSNASLVFDFSTNSTQLLLATNTIPFYISYLVAMIGTLILAILILERAVESHDFIGLSALPPFIFIMVFHFFFGWPSWYYLQGGSEPIYRYFAIGLLCITFLLHFMHYPHVHLMLSWFEYANWTNFIEPFHDLSRPSPADWDQIWRITWSKSVFR